MKITSNKKRKNKKAFGWFQTLNPGNPEYNKDFFNMAMDTGNLGGEGAGGEAMVEAKSSNAALYRKVAGDVRKYLENKYSTMHGHCIEATDLIVDELKEYGINSHYIEGYVLYDCADGCTDTPYDVHNWVITEDNYIIDVTADQFNDFMYEENEYPRIIVQRRLPYNYYEDIPPYSLDDIVESLDKLNEARADRDNFIAYAGEELADLFFKLKPRMKSPENDIYYWINKKSVEELGTFLDELSSTKSGSEKRRQAKEGADLLYNKDGWRVYKINTYGAARYYGSGTKWCITGRWGLGDDQYDNNGEHYFNEYLKNGVTGYYFIIHGNHKWCYLTGDLTYDYALWDEEDSGLDINEITIPRGAPADLFDVLPDFTNKMRRGKVPDSVKIEGEDIVEYYNNNSRDLDVSVAKRITKIVVEEGTSHIRAGAFTDYENLREVILPDSLIGIGPYAFENCYKLRSVIIPDSVERMGQGVFMECQELRSLKISANMTTLPDFLCYNCYNLSEIALNDKITIIGEAALARTASLRYIELPAALFEIKRGAFEDSTLERVILPQNVATIGPFAFKDCRNLYEIILSKNLKYIDTGAFDGCFQLKKLDLTDKIINIGEYAFADTKITTLHLPASIRTIYPHSFAGSNLQILYVPYTWDTLSGAVLYLINEKPDYKIISEIDGQVLTDVIH